MLLLTTQRFEENNSGVAESALNDGDVFPLQRESSGRDGHILYSVLKGLIEAGVLTKAVYDTNADGSVDLADALDYNGLEYIKKDGTKVYINDEATRSYGIAVKDGSVFLISDTAGAVGGAEAYCYANGSSIMTLARMVDYLRKDGTVPMAGGYSPDPGSLDIATAEYVDDEITATEALITALEAKVDTQYENIYFHVPSVASIKDYEGVVVVVPAGETWYVNQAYFKNDSGSCFFTIESDGVALAGGHYTTLESTGALQDSGVHPVALSSGKVLALNCGTTGALNFSCTVVIKRVKT